MEKNKNGEPLSDEMMDFAAGGKIVQLAQAKKCNGIGTGGLLDAQSSRVPKKKGSIATGITKTTLTAGKTVLGTAGSAMEAEDVVQGTTQATKELHQKKSTI